MLESSPPSQPIVLVVDDERLVRTVTAKMVKSLGYESEMVSSGPEAIERVGSNSPPVAVVLLDMGLPGMDGIETLSRLRAVNTSLPIVVMSGYSLCSDRLGDATTLLGKPFTMAELGEALELCLAGR